MAHIHLSVSQSLPHSQAEHRNVMRACVAAHETDPFATMSSCPLETAKIQDGETFQPQMCGSSMASLQSTYTPGDPSNFVLCRAESARAGLRQEARTPNQQASISAPRRPRKDDCSSRIFCMRGTQRLLQSSWFSATCTHGRTVQAVETRWSVSAIRQSCPILIAHSPWGRT